MTNFKRALCVILSVVLLAFSLSSCTVLSSTSKEKETVLYVGDYEVPYEIYYYVNSNLRDEMPDADEKTLEEKTFSIIRELYAVFALGEDFGIEYGDEYIASIAEDAAKAEIERCGSKAAYKKALAESYLNDSVFKFQKRHTQTADEILAAIMNSKDYPSTAEEIKALAMSDEFVRVKQILVLGENSIVLDDTLFSAGEKHTDAEALAIAEKAREKAVKGEDFDSLVNEYGESLFMFNNTDGYYLCRGMWEKVNEDAVFALAVDEVSEVVESSSGFSVFKRLEKEEAYVDAHLDEIAEDYYMAQYNLLLAEKTESLTVKKVEGFDSIVSEEKDTK